MSIYVRNIDLPASVKGVTVQDCDGNYNVYINNSLCDDAKLKICKHELKHINLMHFQDCNSILQNELEASI